MGTKRNVDMSVNNDKIKVLIPEGTEEKVEDQTPEASSDETADQTDAKKSSGKKSTKQSRQRGKRYVASRSLVDRTKEYPLAEAVEMVLKSSYSKFSGTVTADVIVREIGEQGKLTFPHSTGQTIKVEIASDETLAKLEAGTIDFDVLLAEPAYVPKLAKYARLLGPKGMMPNPKNGTITAQPAKRKKELEAGSFTIKSEKKAPLCHVTVGKTDMKPKELIANIETLTKALKGKILKLTLSATMGPGVKVRVEK